MMDFTFSLGNPLLPILLTYLFVLPFSLFSRPIVRNSSFPLFLVLLAIFRPIDNFEDSIRYRGLLEGGIDYISNVPIIKGGFFASILLVFPTYSFKLYIVSFIGVACFLMVYKKILRTTLNDKSLLPPLFILLYTLLFSVQSYFHPRQYLSASLLVLAFSFLIPNPSSSGNLLPQLDWKTRIIYIPFLMVISILIHPIGIVSLVICAFAFCLQRFRFKRLVISRNRSNFYSLIIWIFLASIVILLMAPIVSRLSSSVYAYVVGVLPGYSAYGNWTTESNTSNLIEKFIIYFVIVLHLYPFKLFSSRSSWFYLLCLMYSFSLGLLVEIANNYLSLYSFERLSSGAYPLAFTSFFILFSFMSYKSSFLRLLLPALLSLMTLLYVVSKFNQYNIF